LPSFCHHEQRLAILRQKYRVTGAEHVSARAQHSFRECHALEFILDRSNLQLGFASGLEDVTNGDWNCAALRVLPLRQIEVRCDDAADFLEHQPAGSFTGFSLSNILDGTNTAYAQRLLAAVQQAAALGSTVVLRSFHEPECATQTNHAVEDRAMLWGIVDVRQASTL
jgi:hypothetical protein